MSEKLQSVDESPVNSTFISLLDGISDISPRRDSIWRHSKVDFTVDSSSDGRKDRKYSMTSRGIIRSIVVCKRRDRRLASPEVIMQVAAQVPVWIMEDPRSRKEPLG